MIRPVRYGTVVQLAHPEGRFPVGIACHEPIQTAGLTRPCVAGGIPHPTGARRHQKGDGHLVC